MNGTQSSDINRQTQPQANRFTHAPALYANPLRRLLQVLSWLLWRPLAWRNLVARTDAHLAPDFALLHLSRRQWREGIWRRLLLDALLGCAVVAAVIVGGVGWGVGLPALKLIMSLTFAVTTSLTVGLMIAICVSLAGGIGVSLAVGLAAGLALTFTRYELDWAPNGMPNLNIDDMVQAAAMFCVACAVPAGVGGYVVRMVAANRPAENRLNVTAPSLAQRAGSLAVGIPIALLGVGIASSLASDIARNRALITWPVALLGMSAYALFLGSAVYMRTGRLWDGVRWGGGLAAGVAVSLCVTYFLAYGLAERAPLFAYICFGMAYCIAACLLFSALFTLPHAAASRIAGVQVGAIVGALMIGGGGVGYYVYAVGQYEADWTRFTPVLLLAVAITLLGLLTNWWLPPLLYPLLALWNRLLFRLDEQQSGNAAAYFHRHSAFWNEQQRLPLLGLDEHLVLLLERQPEVGAVALDYLRNSRQAWAARAAQIELDARQLQRCASVSAISAIHRTLAVGELAGPASALLRTFSRLSSDIEVALSQVNAYHQRLGLNAAAERLNGLLRELTRSSEPYAARFYPVAEAWQRLVADHVQNLMQSAERNQEIANPYVVGVPLTQQQEIFVGRTDVIARIEELLAAPDYPPLLLYGQRRMGKTSLLHNLKWLLPFEIIALFVDLQGPVSNASNHAGFLYNMAKLMRKSAEEQGVTLPDLPLATLQSDPFTLFDDWLDAVERTLVAQGRRTILLTLDEFEALDKALLRKALDEEAVLGMVRHLVQYRTRFKVMMAGSHRLQEFQRWAGYLINAQTIHLGYLQEAEAGRLIEQPVRDFPLRYEPAARQAVLALTHGHPYLVQLLCAEIVNLKNEQAPALRRLARRSDVEAAIAATLSTGDQFFTDIYLNQIDDDGRRLLTFLAPRCAARPLPRTALLAHCPDPAALDATLTKLRERELIDHAQHHYSFQVELIRRWFVGQGDKVTG
jgi:hypothetical protein